MRIATWNVNGLRARMEFLELWLASRAPDVVGLQELKTADEEFPFDHFESLGYHASAHGQKGWNGVAVLSREPQTVRQIGLPGQDAMGARLITCEIGDISFTTVYCPNGKSLTHEDYAGKLAWYESFAAHLQAGTSSPQQIICGDFNIVPTPLDGWRGSAADGEMFHTAEERDRLAQIIDLGLTDLYREHAPDEPAFSWWDYRGGAFHRGHGLRIDYLLANAPVVDRLESVVIDRDYRKKQDGLTASDHAPVFADLV